MFRIKPKIISTKTQSPLVNKVPSTGYVVMESVCHSVVSDSLRPHGLQATRLIRPWEFPGKSTGVGCHSLLRNLSWIYIYIFLEAILKRQNEGDSDEINFDNVFYLAPCYNFPVSILCLQHISVGTSHISSAQ